MDIKKNTKKFDLWQWHKEVMANAAQIVVETSDFFWVVSAEILEIPV